MSKSHSEQQYVDFHPPETIERRLIDWRGLRSDVVIARFKSSFDYQFRSNHHLLIVAEHSERDDGETSVEGLPTSTLRSLSGRLTFVPAGHAFRGWQQPSVLTRVTYFYIDPNMPLLQGDLRFGEIDFRPRLFFQDAELWQLAAKLKDEALTSAQPTQYGEALVVMLGHGLIRLEENLRPAPTRGGLSGWQQKRVAGFIEEHLAEEVRLATLAGLVDLSPYHFARAFKQSFGLPPHRYHVMRRIEQAKMMLAEDESSVTAVAMSLGFAETSSFSAAFRKITGVSPRDFRRGLG